MLPLGLLQATVGQPMLVELKNGETINGHLTNCDTYMNLTLREIFHTSSDGETFMHMDEAYVRGNNIKYLRVGDEILEKAKAQQAAQQAARGGHNQGTRGGRGDFHGHNNRGGERGGRGGGNMRGGRGGGGRGGRGGAGGRGGGV